MIVTDQGPPLDNKYLDLLQFLSEFMKDKHAVELVYALKPIIENLEDNDKLVSLLEDLR